jgi:hypothetical protein
MRAQSTDAQLNLPDDPAVSLQQSASPNSQTQTPANGAAGAQTAPAQSAPTQTGTGPSTEEEERKKAKEQLEQQEHQRVLGIMATFNTTRDKDALPLTPGQKFQLFFKSATDPWPFALSAVSAGIDQAENSFPEYGQGAQGYAKRFGADYTDYFTGNFFGNAVLTSWWHEDPRYFQKGTGSFGSRALWAAGSTVWCKRDNGTWGPNYANVMGNLIGAALSNLYYPASDRTVGQTFERGFSVSAQGIVGAEVIEFWPDMVRHYRRKKAEKLAKQEAKESSSQSAPSTAPSPAAQKPQD